MKQFTKTITLAALMAFLSLGGCKRADNSSATPASPAASGAAPGGASGASQ